MKIVINASFLDCIKRIQFYNNIQPKQTKELFFNNTSDKNEFTFSLMYCQTFDFRDDGIYLTIKRTKEEKKEEIERFKKLCLIEIKSLKNWMEQKEEYKTQITEYLKFKRLTWVLD